MSRLNLLRPIAGKILVFWDQEDRDYVASRWRNQGYAIRKSTARLYLSASMSQAAGLPDDYRVDITVYVLQIYARMPTGLGRWSDG